MADRLDHNKDAPFGGCAVVVLPGGETIEFVLLDDKPDVAQFISAVATRIQIIQQELDAKSRSGMAFGR